MLNRLDIYFIFVRPGLLISIIQNVAKTQKDFHWGVLLHFQELVASLDQACYFNYFGRVQGCQKEATEVLQRLLGIH